MGHLEDVVIDSSRRGIGLGRAMVTASISLAEQLGCCQLMLNVSTTIEFDSNCQSLPDRNCVQVVQARERRVLREVWIHPSFRGRLLDLFR